MTCRQKTSHEQQLIKQDIFVVNLDSKNSKDATLPCLLPREMQPGRHRGSKHRLQYHYCRGGEKFKKTRSYHVSPYILGVCSEVQMGILWWNWKGLSKNSMETCRWSAFLKFNVFLFWEDHVGKFHNPFTKTTLKIRQTFHPEPMTKTLVDLRWDFFYLIILSIASCTIRIGSQWHFYMRILS